MTDRLTSILYPVVTFLILLAVWTVSITYFQVPDYILPRPAAVLQSLKVGYLDGEYWPHFLFTLKTTVSGYILGCFLAIAVGAMLAESRVFEKFVAPYIVALQSMPKVALAPLIIVWFGFGLASKIVTVALMCFFPLFVNTVIGIRQTDPALVQMMRSFGASGWLIFFYGKLPAAAGHIFAGLQIGIVLSLIGAIVAEFVASDQGIGGLIQSSLANFDTARMFAALFSLIAIGLCGTQIVQWLHRRFVFWNKGMAKTALAE